MNKNCFTKDIHQYTYFAKYLDHYENEWGLETDEKGKLVNINVGNGQGCVMSGISYWAVNDARLISNSLIEIIKRGDFTEFFGDNIVLSLYHSINIQVNQFDEIHEIDNGLELKDVKSLLQ